MACVGPVAKSLGLHSIPERCDKHKAIRRDSTERLLWLLLDGLVLFIRGDPEAVSLFNTAFALQLRLGSSCLDAQVLLAEAHLQNLDLDGAAQVLESARARIASAKTVNKVYLGQLYGAEAHLLMEMGNFESATERLLSSITECSQEPAYTSAFMMKQTAMVAEAYTRLGEYEKAKAMVSNAISLMPADGGSFHEDFKGQQLVLLHLAAAEVSLAEGIHKRSKAILEECARSAQSALKILDAPRETLFEDMTSAGARVHAYNILAKIVANLQVGDLRTLAAFDTALGCQSAFEPSCPSFEKAVVDLVKYCFFAIERILSECTAEEAKNAVVRGGHFTYLHAALMDMVVEPIEIEPYPRDHYLWSFCLYADFLEEYCLNGGCKRTSYFLQTIDLQRKRIMSCLGKTHPYCVDVTEIVANMHVFASNWLMASRLASEVVQARIDYIPYYKARLHETPELLKQQTLRWMRWGEAEHPAFSVPPRQPSAMSATVTPVSSAAPVQATRAAVDAPAAAPAPASAAPARTSAPAPDRAPAPEAVTATADSASSYSFPFSFPGVPDPYASLPEDPPPLVSDSDDEDGDGPPPLVASDDEKPAETTPPSTLSAKKKKKKKKKAKKKKKKAKTETSSVQSDDEPPPLVDSDDDLPPPPKTSSTKKKEEPPSAAGLPFTGFPIIAQDPTEPGQFVFRDLPLPTQESDEPPELVSSSEDEDEGVPATKAAAPASKAAAPVSKAAAPVSKAAAPVSKAAAPVSKAAPGETSASSSKAAPSDEFRADVNPFTSDEFHEEVNRFAELFAAGFAGAESEDVPPLVDSDEEVPPIVEELVAPDECESSEGAGSMSALLARRRKRKRVRKPCRPDDPELPTREMDEHGFGCTCCGAVAEPENDDPPNWSNAFIEYETMPKKYLPDEVELRKMESHVMDLTALQFKLRHRLHSVYPRRALIVYNSHSCPTNSSSARDGAPVSLLARSDAYAMSEALTRLHFHVNTVDSRGYTGDSLMKLIQQVLTNGCMEEDDIWFHFIGRTVHHADTDSLVLDSSMHHQKGLLGADRVVSHLSASLARTVSCVFDTTFSPHLLEARCKVASVKNRQPRKTQDLTDFFNIEVLIANQIPAKANQYVPGTMTKLMVPLLGARSQYLGRSRSLFQETGRSWITFRRLGFNVMRKLRDEEKTSGYYGELNSAEGKLGSMILSCIPVSACDDDVLGSEKDLCNLRFKTPKERRKLK